VTRPDGELDVPLLDSEASGSDVEAGLRVWREFYDAARAPAADLASIRELCEAQVPSEAREHVRVELEQERQQ
jgi:hypothetical protein